MTEQDKQLLLRDLCSRLPYGVNLHIEFYDLQGDGELASRDVKLTAGNICYCFDNGHWVNFKPYLRPMSSMTEEEIDYVERHFYYTGYNDWDFVDWLNKNHFDFRRLIPMGLALEAPEGMYKTK